MGSTDEMCDAVVVEQIDDLTDAEEHHVDLPEPAVIVRFRNVASRRPVIRAGTSAEWPPTPPPPAPVRRSARIYQAVIRPPSAG
jgi:hypothetical protein